MAETEKNQQNHQKSCDSCLGSEICDLGSPDKCGFYLPFEDFRAKALEEHADNVANAKFKSIVNEILKTKERGTCMSQEKEKNVDSLADTFSVEFDDIFEAEEDATSANEKINDSVNVDDAEEVVNEQESDNCRNAFLIRQGFLTVPFKKALFMRGYKTLQVKPQKQNPKKATF